MKEGPKTRQQNAAWWGIRFRRLCARLGLEPQNEQDTEEIDGFTRSEAALHELAHLVTLTGGALPDCRRWVDAIGTAEDEPIQMMIRGHHGSARIRNEVEAIGVELDVMARLCLGFNVQGLLTYAASGCGITRVSFSRRLARIQGDDARSAELRRYARTIVNAAEGC